MMQEAKLFWEQRYAERLSRKRGQAGQFLKQLVLDLPPQRVLELGCSTGDDSLWLAEQGWQVTAVDISEHAIQTARRLAQEAGLAKQIAFLACDLSNTLPAGQFELVCALYFQSPFDFPRIKILQAAAQRIVKGGHLLMITHASGPSWSEQPQTEHPFPTLAQDWQALALSSKDWQLKHFSVETRLIKGPQGQEAEVKDNLIFAQRS